MARRFRGRRIGEGIAQVTVEPLRLQIAGCHIDRNKLSTRAEQLLLRCGNEAPSGSLVRSRPTRPPVRTTPAWRHKCRRRSERQHSRPPVRPSYRKMPRMASSQSIRSHAQRASTAAWLSTSNGKNGVSVESVNQCREVTRVSMAADARRCAQFAR